MKNGVNRKWGCPGRKQLEDIVGVPSGETTTKGRSFVEDSLHEASNFVVVAKLDAITVSRESLRDGGLIHSNSLLLIAQLEEVGEVV